MILVVNPMKLPVNGYVPEQNLDEASLFGKIPAW
jgi:hypothetical protein